MIRFNKKVLYIVAWELKANSAKVSSVELKALVIKKRKKKSKAALVFYMPSPSKSAFQDFSLFKYKFLTVESSLGKTFYEAKAYIGFVKTSDQTREYESQVTTGI